MITAGRILVVVATLQIFCWLLATSSRYMERRSRYRELLASSRKAYLDALHALQEGKRMITLIGKIPQIGGITRCLLASSYSGARNQAALWRASGCADATTADYVVDDDDGRLTAVRYPGSTISAAEWSAIRTACR